MNADHDHPARPDPGEAVLLQPGERPSGLVIPGTAPAGEADDVPVRSRCSPALGLPCPSDSVTVVAAEPSPWSNSRSCGSDCRNASWPSAVSVANCTARWSLPTVTVARTLPRPSGSRVRVTWWTPSAEARKGDSTETSWAAGGGGVGGAGAGESGAGVAGALAVVAPGPALADTAAPSAVDAPVDGTGGGALCGPGAVAGEPSPAAVGEPEVVVVPARVRAPLASAPACWPVSEVVWRADAAESAWPGPTWAAPGGVTPGGVALGGGGVPDPMDPGPRSAPG